MRYANKRSSMVPIDDEPEVAAPPPPQLPAAPPPLPPTGGNHTLGQGIGVAEPPEPPPVPSKPQLFGFTPAPTPVPARAPAQPPAASAPPAPPPPPPVPPPIQATGGHTPGGGLQLSTPAGEGVITRRAAPAPPPGQQRTPPRAGLAWGSGAQGEGWHDSTTGAFVGDDTPQRPELPGSASAAITDKNAQLLEQLSAEIRSGGGHRPGEGVAAAPPPPTLPPDYNTVAFAPGAESAAATLSSIGYDPNKVYSNPQTADNPEPDAASQLRYNQSLVDQRRKEYLSNPENQYTPGTTENPGGELTKAPAPEFKERPVRIHSSVPGGDVYYDEGPLTQELIDRSQGRVTSSQPMTSTTVGGVSVDPKDGAAAGAVLRAKQAEEAANEPLAQLQSLVDKGYGSAEPTTPPPPPSIETLVAGGGEAPLISRINPDADLRTAQIGTEGYEDSADTRELRDLTAGSAKGLSSAPSRRQIAEDTYGLLEERANEELNKRVRSIGQRAASLGRLGSGMTEDEILGNSATGEEGALGAVTKELGRQRKELSLNAAGREMDDRLNTLQSLYNTTQGLQGMDVTRAGARQQNRNELRGERSYQQIAAQQALENRIRQVELEDQLTGSDHARELAQLQMLMEFYGQSDPTRALLSTSALEDESAAGGESLLGDLGYIFGSRPPSTPPAATAGAGASAGVLPGNTGTRPRDRRGRPI